MDPNLKFEEIVKLSFLKVKDDLKMVKYLLEEQNNHIFRLDNELKSNLSFINELKSKIDTLTKSSTGNEGVEYFQPPASHQPATPPTIAENSEYSVKSIQKDVIKMVRNLTQKEFELFLTLNQLENELKTGVSYYDLAVKLSLTRRRVSELVKNIMLKDAPIEKIEKPNQRTLIFVKKEFKELNFSLDLAKLRYYIDVKGLKPDDLDKF